MFPLKCGIRLRPRTVYRDLHQNIILQLNLRHIGIMPVGEHRHHAGNPVLFQAPGNVVQKIPHKIRFLRMGGIEFLTLRAHTVLEMVFRHQVEKARLGRGRVP